MWPSRYYRNARWPFSVIFPDAHSRQAVSMEEQEHSKEKPSYVREILEEVG